MRYEIDMEKEMEKQAEIEQEFVGRINKIDLWGALDDVRMSLKDDGIEFDDGVDTEESFRIKNEYSI
jgi:hypothetical protein